MNYIFNNLKIMLLTLLQLMKCRVLVKIPPFIILSFLKTVCFWRLVLACKVYWFISFLEHKIRSL